MTIIRLFCLVIYCYEILGLLLKNLIVQKRYAQCILALFLLFQSLECSLVLYSDVLEGLGGGLTLVTNKRQTLPAVLLHPGPEAEHGHTRVFNIVLISVGDVGDVWGQHW